jgi:uncharacterized protein
MASAENVHVAVADVRWVQRAEPEKSEYIVVLRELHGDALLPIWVAPLDGTVIAAHLRRVEMPRPLTYVLMNTLLTAAGAKIVGVVIERASTESFFADVLIQSSDGVQRRVDARPSDAIALSLTTGAPIRVASVFLEEAANYPELDAGVGAKDIVAALCSPIAKEIKTYWPWDRPQP